MASQYFNHHGTNAEDVYIDADGVMQEAAVAAAPQEAAVPQEAVVQVAPQEAVVGEAAANHDVAASTTAVVGARVPSGMPTADVVLPVEQLGTGQHVLVHGLQARPDLNGKVGEVLGREAGGRVPLKLLAGGERVKIRPANLFRTDASPEEGQMREGRVMIYGEWFDINALLDQMANGGAAVGSAFRDSPKHMQADVLAGRHVLGVPHDPTLPLACPRREWIGSGGSLCDGCGQTRVQVAALEWGDEAEEINSDQEAELIETCSRCMYSACGECRVHHSRGTCFCKDSNFDFVYPPEDEREWYHRGYW